MRIGELERLLGDVGSIGRVWDEDDGVFRVEVLADPESARELLVQGVAQDEEIVGWFELDAALSVWLPTRDLAAGALASALIDAALRGARTLRAPLRAVQDDDPFVSGADWPYVVTGVERFGVESRLLVNVTALPFWLHLGSRRGGVVAWGRLPAGRLVDLGEELVEGDGPLTLTRGDGRIARFLIGGEDASQEIGALGTCVRRRLLER